MNRQTTLAKNHEVTRAWVQIDATDKVLGRLAAEVATILMGKNKATYTPHHDVGDFVVITNCEKVKLTGKKLDQKSHMTYSGHPGGHKSQTLRTILATHPDRVIENAVKRMMPKNKIAVHQLTKLKIYAGAKHPHTAQAVKTVSVAA